MTDETGPLQPSLRNGAAMQPELRRATVHDAAAVTELIDAAYQHYVERIGRLPAPMREDYAQVIAVRDVTLASVAGSLAGVIVLHQDEVGFLIENVAVHPRQQRRGLGKALLAYAESVATSAGYDSIYLYTHELMVENIALYQSLGYAEYDRRDEGGFSRVFLCKQLTRRDTP